LLPQKVAHYLIKKLLASINPLSLSRSMSFLGDVSIERDDTRVNGDIMFSFLYTNNADKLADNDRTHQNSGSLTNRLHMEFHEDDTQQIQDMNFTLISTLRATGATTSMSSEVTTERFKEFRLSNSNVSLAISKVRTLKKSVES
jgi:hypothetical protein